MKGTMHQTQLNGRCTTPRPHEVILWTNIGPLRLSLQAARAAAEAARVEADQCRRRSDCLEIALSTATHLAPNHFCNFFGGSVPSCMERSKNVHTLV